MTKNDLRVWKEEVDVGDIVMFNYIDVKGRRSRVKGTAKIGYRRPSGTSMSNRKNPFKPHEDIDGMSINTNTGHIFLDIDNPESDRSGSVFSVFKRYDIERVSNLQIVGGKEK